MRASSNGGGGRAARARGNALRRRSLTHRRVRSSAGRASATGIEQPTTGWQNCDAGVWMNGSAWVLLASGGSPRAARDRGQWNGGVRGFGRGSPPSACPVRPATRPMRAMRTSRTMSCAQDRCRVRHASSIRCVSMAGIAVGEHLFDEQEYGVAIRYAHGEDRDRWIDVYFYPAGALDEVAIRGRGAPGSRPDPAGARRSTASGIRDGRAGNVRHGPRRSSREPCRRGHCGRPAIRGGWHGLQFGHGAVAGSPVFREGAIQRRAGGAVARADPGSPRGFRPAAAVPALDRERRRGLGARFAGCGPGSTPTPANCGWSSIRPTSRTRRWPGVGM